jgi:hypothetical protein
VVAEESDLTIDGQRSSHYEMHRSDDGVRSQLTGIEHFLTEVNSLKKYFVAIKKQFTS